MAAESGEWGKELYEAMTDLLPDWYQIAELHFTEPRTSTLDQIAHTCGLDEYDPPQPPRFRLFDHAGRPILCRICAGNAWTREDEKRFVCEDHPEYADLPIRSVVECLVAEVGRYEPVE